MKNIFTLINSFFFIAITFAQSPKRFNYQAVIRDSGGNVITSQNVGVKFSIHQSSASGTIVYSETQSPTTNEFGLINLQIGMELPLLDKLKLLIGDPDPIFLKHQLMYRVEQIMYPLEAIN